MDFLELTKNAIQREIKCARFAPSAVNYQPWHFIVVKSEEQKQKLRQCYSQQWFFQAPLYIIICVDRSLALERKSDNKSHADIDAAIAIEHICMAASQQGLGSSWVSNYDLDIFKSNFPLPANEYPVAIIPIGYTKEGSSNHSSRKEIAEIVSTI